MEKKTGVSVLAYTGVQPRTPPEFLTHTRAPRVTDYKDYFTGTFWLHMPNKDLWLLVSKNNNQGQWIRFITSASTSDLETLTGNTGGAVGPDVAGNIDFVGLGILSVAGTPASNLLEISLTDDVAVDYITDSGTANANAANELQVLGGPSLDTAAAGNMVFVNLTDPGDGVVHSVSGVLFGDRGNDGEILIGQTGGAEAWASITSLDGTVVITPGANTIDLSATAGMGDVQTLTGNLGGAVGPDGSGDIDFVGLGLLSVTGTPASNLLEISLTDDVAVDYITDSGTANANAANELQILGGPSLDTSAVGNAISVNLTDPGDGVVHSVGGVLFGDRGNDGEILIGQTGGAEAWGSITSGDGTVVITPGANTIDLSAAAAAVNTIFTRFTANGVWNKNANTKYVEVYIWDGGGSGGSGRRGLSTAAGGGAGGSRGGTFYWGSPSFIVPNAVAVTVGAGTAGGAAVVVNNTDGNPGLHSTFSGFGNLSTYYPYAPDGPAGGGINGAATNTNRAPRYYWPDQASSYTSANYAGDGSLTAGIGAVPLGSGNRHGSATAVTPSYHIAGSGGGGGGADSVTERRGGDGSSLNDPNRNIVVAGGLAGLESTGINGTNGPDNNTFTYEIIVGGLGGGGGGGQSAGAAAGNGGNGGIPGGGGGGGGGSLNGTASGAGGNGARGEVIVIEYL